MLVNAAVNTDAGDGLGPLAQVGLLSPGVVLTVALAGLFLVLVAGILGLLAVRWVRRSRLWSSGVLALRSETGTGTGSELAALRLQLNRAIDATDAALAAARTSDRFTGELSASAVTLTQTARAVDRQLRTAQRDPDPGTKAAALAALRRQVSSWCAPRPPSGRDSPGPTRRQRPASSSGSRPGDPFEATRPHRTRARQRRRTPSESRAS